MVVTGKSLSPFRTFELSGFPCGAGENSKDPPSFFLLIGGNRNAVLDLAAATDVGLGNVREYFVSECDFLRPFDEELRRLKDEELETRGCATPTGGRSRPNFSPLPDEVLLRPGLVLSERPSYVNGFMGLLRMLYHVLENHI